MNSLVISLGKCLRHLAIAGLLAAAIPRPAAAVECWQGWGYWVDAQTRAYKSQELLLVTDGPAGWAAGNSVILRVLDRATGRIDGSKAPIVAFPLKSRVYYRGNANYVDGLADGFVVVWNQQQVLFAQCFLDILKFDGSGLDVTVDHGVNA